MSDDGPWALSENEQAGCSLCGGRGCCQIREETVVRYGEDYCQVRRECWRVRGDHCLVQEGDYCPLRGDYCLVQKGDYCLVGKRPLPGA